MNRTRSREPVLTDYVRARLDRWAGERRGSPDDPDTEAAVQTVLRPRPALIVSPEPWPEPDLSGQAAESPDSSENAGGWQARFTRRHLMVVAVVLAVGALLAGYAVTRAKAVPIVAPVVVESQGPSASAASGRSDPTPTALPVRVHVVGEVRQPGVHTLAQGSRVVEAIEAAGGLTPRANPGELNLAQVLVDGQQVLVGNSKQPSEVRGAEPAAGGASAAGPGGKVNLNNASAAQLDSLPGVGPVTAEKIIAWRTEHGRFTRIEELQEVPGIGPKSYAELAPHVTV